MLLYPRAEKALDFKMTMLQDGEIESLTKNVNSLRISNAVNLKNGRSESRVKSKIPSDLKIIKVTRKIKDENKVKRESADNKKSEKLFIQTVKTNDRRKIEDNLGIEEKLQNLLRINDLPQKCDFKKNPTKVSTLKPRDSNDDCTAENETKPKKQTKDKDNSESRDIKDLKLVLPTKVDILEEKRKHIDAKENHGIEDKVKHKTRTSDKASDVNGHPIIDPEVDDKDFELIPRGGIRSRVERNCESRSPYARPLPAMVNRNSLSGGVIIEQSYPERISSPQIPTTINFPCLQQGDLCVKDLNFNSARRASNTNSSGSTSEIDDANIIIDSLVQQLEREDSIKESLGHSPGTAGWDGIFADDQISFDEILKELMNLPCEVPSMSPTIVDGSFELNPNDNYLYPSRSPDERGSSSACGSESSYASSPGSSNYSPRGDYCGPPNRALLSPTDAIELPLNISAQSSASPTNSLSSNYSYSCSPSHGSPLSNSSYNETSIVIQHVASPRQSPMQKLIGCNLLSRFRFGHSPKVNATVGDSSKHNCCKKVFATAEESMKDNYKSLEENIQRKCMEAVSKLPDPPDSGLGRYLNDAMKSLSRTESISTTRNIHLAVIYIVCERLIMSNKFLQYEFAIKVNQHNSHVVVGHQLLQLAVLKYQNIPLLAEYFGQCIIRSYGKSHPEVVDYKNFDFDMFSNSARNTLIHHLAVRGDGASELLASLLCLRWPNKKAVYNCNEKNTDGYTPLHLACLSNPHQLDTVSPVTNNERVSYCRTIHVLLKHGSADITLKDSKSGNTPLHTAVNSLSCDPETVGAILDNLPPEKRKAIVSDKNYTSRTPLDLARMARNSNRGSGAAKTIVSMLKSVK